jgi:lipopolysaccharide export system protein LptA
VKQAGNGAKPGAAPSPAFTWSDQLTAAFQPGSNQVATIEQGGNFRYSEGERKASAAKAFLDQMANRMTLTDRAHVTDDTGSTFADQIVMDQSSGDMDAAGHVVSTHAPNKNQKPGTSMLDETQPMQARADRMSTRESNTAICYEGHAVLWQGANRTTADKIEIDRKGRTLHATGNVVSELLDKTSDSGPTPAATPLQSPIFTTVFAPELNYSDATRIAHYTGGVKLTRQNMIVTSQEITAYLTPKTQGSDDSSLDHAVATGNVSVFDKVANNRTRTGTGEHCEYFTRDGKVTLWGGAPRLVDSYKGTTEGAKLTYFSNDDHVIVDGGSRRVFTEIRKKK